MSSLDPAALGVGVIAPSDLRGEQHAGVLPANSHSNGYESARVVKSGPGVLCGFTVYNSGGAQFIQVHDSAVTPTTGAIPAVVLAVAGTANVSGLWLPGRIFQRGIVVANSSTGPTYTAGGADCFIDAQYL